MTESIVFSLSLRALLPLDKYLSLSASRVSPIHRSRNSHSKALTLIEEATARLCCTSEKAFFSAGCENWVEGNDSESRAADRLFTC